MTVEDTILVKTAIRSGILLNPECVCKRCGKPVTPHNAKRGLCKECSLAVG